MTSGSTPEVLSSFPGASLSSDTAAFGNDQNVQPPDTQVAIGQNDIVEAVNDTLIVWSRSGAELSHFDLNTFFPVPSGYSFTDPRVAYDSSTARYFLSGFAFNSSNNNSVVYIAVSNTSDPTQGWTVYTVTSETDITDQPKLGFDANVVVLSWNDYASTSSTSPSGSETWVLQKSDMLTGASVAMSHFGPDTTRFDIVPAVSLSASNTEYLAYNDSCGSKTTGSCNYSSTSAIGAVALTGTPALGNVTWTETDLPFTTTQSPPLADQPNATASISTDDDRFLTTSFLNGTLYVSGNDTCTPSGDTTSRPCARVVEVAVSSMTVTLDTDFGLAGADIYYPAVMPDASGNLVIAATLSSTSIYPEAVVLTFPAGASSYVYTGVQPGAGTYVNSLGTRWGDYSGISVDPNDPNDVVVAAEYAPADASTGNWATAIGDVTLAAPTVSGVSPTGGSTSGGTAVTLTGSEFAPGSQVDFGSTPATNVSVISPTEITASAPSGASGSVNVTVTTADGSSVITTADEFSYTSPPPTTTTSPPPPPTTTTVSPPTTTTTTTLPPPPPPPPPPPTTTTTTTTTTVPPTTTTLPPHPMMSVPAVLRPLKAIGGGFFIKLSTNLPGVVTLRFTYTRSLRVRLHGRYVRRQKVYIYAIDTTTVNGGPQLVSVRPRAPALKALVASRRLRLSETTTFTSNGQSTLTARRISVSYVSPLILRVPVSERGGVLRVPLLARSPGIATIRLTYTSEVSHQASSKIVRQIGAVRPAPARTHLTAALYGALVVRISRGAHVVLVHPHTQALALLARMKVLALTETVVFGTADGRAPARRQVIVRYERP